MVPDLLACGGVDGVYDWCGTIYTEVNYTVRDRWRRPRVVSAEGIRREGPKFLTGRDIQRMQLAVSAAGIGRIQLAFKYACRGKAAPPDVGPPLHRQVRHVYGGEDCLIGVHAAVCGVEAEVGPISSRN